MNGSYKIIISTLCTITVFSLLGGIYLSIIDKQIPDSLMALGSSALGTLAGLLAPSPLGNAK
jgi:hypothetical protein